MELFAMHAAGRKPGEMKNLWVCGERDVGRAKANGLERLLKIIAELFSISISLLYGFMRTREYRRSVKDMRGVRMRSSVGGLVGYQ